MKTLFALLCCTLFAWGAALDLPEALTAVATRTEVVNAQLTLDDAETSLDRTEADPLALRLERAQAQQRSDLSAAQLRQARYQAIADVAAAYTGLLEAQAQRDLASAAREVRTQVVDITKIRVERGSATALDLQEAQNDLQDAEKNLRAAEQGVDLAKTNLEGLLGQEVDAVEPISEEVLAALPSLETVLLNLRQNPQLVQVGQGVELAEIGLDLLDPSYASRAQLDNARLQLSQTEESAKEARRGLELQARSLYNNARTALQTYRNAAAALESATERETLEQQRLDAGLIADITFKQTQLATFNAFIATLQAKHAYLNALLELQASTMTPLEGLNDF